MEHAPKFALRERNEIENLLSEARALHNRVTTILSDVPPASSIPEARMAPSAAWTPAYDDGMPSTTQSWEDLFQRGRELDERVQRLRFEVPSPKPLRERVWPAVDEERRQRDVAKARLQVEDSDEENVQEVAKVPIQSRPLTTSASAPSLPAKDDPLLRPTLRPIARFEPGLPAFKNDPVRRYELYKHEWAKFPAPGEKKHLALRWKIREYMLRVDLPSNLNNAKLGGQI